MLVGGWRAARSFCGGLHCAVAKTSSEWISGHESGKKSDKVVFGVLGFLNQGFSVLFLGRKLALRWVVFHNPAVVTPWVCASATSQRWSGFLSEYG